MPIEVLMPALSPTMKDGVLAKWCVKEGDKIKAGDVIAEVETDKAMMEVESSDAGIVGKIFVADGTPNVLVGSLIAVLLKNGEDASAINGYDVSKKQNIAVENSTENVEVVAVKKTIDSKDEKSERIFATPLAKRIAQQSSVNLLNIEGSGPRGRIIANDVLNVKLSNDSAVAKPTIINGRMPDVISTIKPSNMRVAIAKRLQESKSQAPHFYLSLECNITSLLKLREHLNSQSLKDNDGHAIKISVNDVIIKACATAISHNLYVNASWTDAGIVHYGNIDISVAVSIAEGLMTPIVKNANLLGLSQISTEVKRLAKKAKEGTLKPDEFQGGGFSVSNLGMYGVKDFYAIINPPQSCILSVGASEKRPIFDEAGQVVAADILTLGLSVDHRIVDGAKAAEFLKYLKNIIENPIMLSL
jgi:pyruvate dehydrogenase E2 component (dihydrolipoamide acetyltransferase)